MALETHGRWPWGAAAGALPVTLLARRRREWLPLAALLWHQTEEWVWPGGFLPWFNRRVAGSQHDEFPLTRSLGVAINCGLGWGLSALDAVAGDRAAAPSALLFTTHVGNAALHTTTAIRERRWNPGAITGSALLLPVGLAGLRRLWRAPDVARGAVVSGTVVGAAISAAGPSLLRRRNAARSA